MKLLSDNIIFFDTEFSSLDPYKGEILSLGLVKFNGEELYLELEHKGEVSDWVKENVIPFLVEKKTSKEGAIRKIKKFAGDTKPYVMAYVNQFDIVYFHKIIKCEDNPFYWIPINFASVLFALGIDSERYNLEDRDNFYQEMGIDYNKYRKHHALDDAKLLRETYLKLIRGN